MPWPLPAPDNDFLADQATLLLESYQRLLKRPLLESAGTPRERAEALWRAPFVVASHDTRADPIFNYANQAALSLWEMTWEEFTALPSRLSAEPVEQSQRQALLDAVTTRGYIDHYCGIRIAKTGRRFRIDEATVWNVLDHAGIYCGQAVYFRRFANLVAKAGG